MIERVATEAPFIGYQATIALLNAARSLDMQQEQRLREALHQAKTSLVKVSSGSDQMAYLVQAEYELDSRKESNV